MYRYSCAFRASSTYTPRNLRRSRPSISTSTGETTATVLTSVKPHHEDRWERNFEQLEKELASNAKHKDRLWRQRMELSKRNEGEVSALNDQQLSLDFDHGIFAAKERQSWHDSYDELVKFLQKHNGLFPFEIEKEAMTIETRSLEEWCTKQRNAYQMNQKGITSPYINAERIEKLEKIEFRWNVHDVKWSQKHRELVEYYKIHGDSMVPRDYAKNPGLAGWVKRQRQSKPTPERKKLLEDVDFVWDVIEYSWMLKYKELRAYMAAHGRGMVPAQRNRRYGSLNRWVRYQNECYQRYLAGDETRGLTEHRRQLLEDLGLNFEKKKQCIGQLKQERSFIAKSNTNATKDGSRPDAKLDTNRGTS